MKSECEVLCKMGITEPLSMLEPDLSPNGIKQNSAQKSLPVDLDNCQKESQYGERFLYVFSARIQRQPHDSQLLTWWLEAWPDASEKLNKVHSTNTSERPGIHDEGRA